MMDALSYAGREKLMDWAVVSQELRGTWYRTYKRLGFGVVVTCMFERVILRVIDSLVHWECQISGMLNHAAVPSMCFCPSVCLRSVWWEMVERRMEWLGSTVRPEDA